MLGRVAALRGLGPERGVQATVLGRDAVIARIIAKTEREIPEHALRAQGELLAALGLLPTGYDFVAGVYALLRSEIAGFYDTTEKRLFLLDDLPDREAEPTLAHELVHALQDQHFALEALTKYRPGEGDRIGAAHALGEGDATSAMLDLTAGSAMRFEQQWLRLAMVASVALSEAGVQTPPVLRAALVAPYVDGFAFVQDLRRRGGWAAVDAAWRRPPASTEQLLHVGKYDSGEPVRDVAAPALEPLGEGWQALDADVLGEQGLRIVLEQWTDRAQAARAAAGWGGDRYVVARRAPAAPARDEQLAAAWLVRFDSAGDAAEMAAVLRRAMGHRCTDRPERGPIAWQLRRDLVVLAAGPYVRDGQGKMARPDAVPNAGEPCRLTGAWTGRILGDAALAPAR
ncbi:MAG: hypothetical protein HY744_34570 [Deltaproteobacteria bacterium]|nr:hypothetical protein [Deltaproteobacteria bacterium]